MDPAPRENKITLPAKFTFILIVLAPLLFLFTSHEWLYAPIKSFDSNHDLAYSFFYDMGHFKDTYYKSSRVPWISILFYLQKVVGGLLLSPVLTVGFLLSVSTLFLFLIKTLFGTRPALLLAPWLVFFPHLFGTIPGGILYNNTAAIIYFLLSLILWAKSRSDKNDLIFPALAGFFMASAFYTNIIYINLLLLFPLIEHHKNIRFRTRNYLWLIPGFVAATLFWGVINTLHGRAFFFFSNMFNFAGHLLLNPKDQSLWFKPFHQIFFLRNYKSFHLIFLFSLFIIALLKIRQLKTDRLRFYTFNYITLILLWIFWQLSGQLAFSPPDNSYALIIPFFLMLASWVPAFELNKKDIYFALLSMLFLWLCLFFSDYLKSELLTRDGAGTPLVLTLTAITAAALFFVFIKTRPDILRLTALFVLGIVYALTNLESRSSFLGTCRIREEGYNSLIHIISTVQKVDPVPRNISVFGAYSESIPLPEGACYPDVYVFRAAYPQLLIAAAGKRFGNFDRIEARFGSIDELKDSDFQNVKRYIAVFPFEQAGFTTELAAKAASFGYNLSKVESHLETVMGQPVPYEIWEISGRP